MENLFYRPFDCERSDAPSSRVENRDIRTPFQIDTGIGLCFPMRSEDSSQKLRSSNQSEFDFYRTRLTHSMEVAKIARSITDYLNHESPLLGDDFHIDTRSRRSSGHGARSRTSSLRAHWRTKT